MYGGSNYSRVQSDCCVMFSSQHGGFLFYFFYSKTSSVSIAYRVQVPNSKTACVKGTRKQKNKQQSETVVHF